jgi:hypothetical protein
MNPEAIYKGLVESGEAYAESRFQWEQLDGQTKSILAAITIEAKNLEECSMAEANSIALSTDTYRTHLGNVAVAHRAMLVSKVQYDSRNALWECQRSVESTSRAAMASQR